MRGNRRVDTGPERQVRSLLHRAGLRFRKDYRVQLPGHRGVRVDIAFPRQRLAVFIDGCFWHRCPEHGKAPARNADYWLPKLDRNVDRDRAVTQALPTAGWRVLRFWEHESPEAVAEAVAAAVR